MLLEIILLTKHYDIEYIIYMVKISPTWKDLMTINVLSLIDINDVCDKWSYYFFWNLEKILKNILDGFHLMVDKTILKPFFTLDICHFLSAVIWNYSIDYFLKVITTSSIERKRKKKA